VALLRPCADADPATMDKLKELQSYADDAKQKCKEMNSCTLMFTESSPRYLTTVGAEIRKALGDPNYSSSLGTFGAGAPTASGSTPAVRACRARLSEIENQLNESRAKLPASEVVRLLELIMWAAQESAHAIERGCPDSPDERAIRQTNLTDYAKSKLTCDKMASSACVARRP
jgi:hypothetical protein